MNGLKYSVGIDLGGTFTKYALMSERGDIITENKILIKKDASKDLILETIGISIERALNKAAEKGLEVMGIGIGTPGIVCDGVVIGGADNLNDWVNIKLSKIYSKKFKLPVFIDNDANVMGLAEATFGSAKNCTDVIFVTVGTGIGGAIIANGELYGGYQNKGTEFGHVTINHNGIDCNCGGRGCLEAYASTAALVKQYASLTGRDEHEIDGWHVVRKFKEGEAEAQQCLKEHTEYLGHGIAGFVNIFSPQKVVIGGGISESGSFYIEMIRNATFRYAMPDTSVSTEIVGADLGNMAGSIGAASLVFKNMKI